MKSSLEPSRVPRRVGVWIVGARGSVATTAMLGSTALASGLVDPIGLVTELPALSGADLLDFDEMVFGGHDVVDTPLLKRAEALAGGGVLPPRLVEACGDFLTVTEEELRVGYRRGSGEPLATAVDRLAADIVSFQRRSSSSSVVVVDLASVEAPPGAQLDHATVDELLESDEDVSAGVVYALAAMRAGAAFVDFTPSSALVSPLVRELAQQSGLPVAGRDGKTGETLVKSALAPMFARRNLRVRSWAGINLLGGGDGASLASPRAAEAKLASKGGTLQSALGYSVDAPLHIDYLEDAGEWKTAWDHIAFDGFLGARMTMQFTWHGCDSALAAPLVLDLVRLVDLASRRGHSGFVEELGFFFKDPVTSDVHALDEQFRVLCDWVVDEEG